MLVCLKMLVILSRLIRQELGLKTRMVARSVGALLEPDPASREERGINQQRSARGLLARPYAQPYDQCKKKSSKKMSMVA